MSKSGGDIKYHGYEYLDKCVRCGRPAIAKLYHKVVKVESFDYLTAEIVCQECLDKVLVKEGKSNENTL